MRAWQVLASLVLLQIAATSAYTLYIDHSHDSYVSHHLADDDDDHSDLEVAASDHKGSSSGFEEDGGSDHGSDHYSKGGKKGSDGHSKKSSFGKSEKGSHHKDEHSGKIN